MFQRLTFALALVAGMGALVSARYPEVPAPLPPVLILDPSWNGEVEAGSSFTAYTQYWCPDEENETYAVGQWVEKLNNGKWEDVNLSNLANGLTGTGKLNDPNTQSLAVGTYAACAGMVRDRDLKYVGGGWVQFRVVEPKAYRRR